MKENDLAHGEFGKWLEKVGLDKYQASRFIKVANEQSKLHSSANLGLKALYQIATIPVEHREEKQQTSSGEMKTPYEMTNKEREEFKRNSNNAMKKTHNFNHKWNKHNVRRR